MSENIKNLIFITGAASHTSDVDPAENMDYQEYRKSLKTPYLLYQLTFIVCDLLVWYDNYIKENYDSSINKSFWDDCNENQLSSSESEWLEGTVTRISEDNYGTFKPDNSINTITIYHSTVRNENIKEEDRLKVRTEPSPDGKKLHIKEIIKLN